MPERSIHSNTYRYASQRLRGFPEAGHLVAERPLLAMPMLLLQAGTLLQDRGARRVWDGEYRTYTQDHFSVCVSHTPTPLLRTPSAHWNHQQSSHGQQVLKHLLYADTALYSPRLGALPGPLFCLQFVTEPSVPPPMAPPLGAGPFPCPLVQVPGPRSSCPHQDK